MNKLFLSTTCWLVLGVSLWADPSSSPKGVIVLTSASGLDPRNVLFTDLSWADFYGGNVIDTNGRKSVFAKKDIGKIVYFDSNYYAQLDNDQQKRAFRSGIQAREVVVNTAYSNLDATNNLKSIQDGEKTLESVAHEYPAIQPLIQPQIDVLKDDITKLSEGQCLADGKWMSQQEAATKNTVPVVGEINKPVTFTTKDGKKYVNATVSITDTGLSVLTLDGGASVPFDQLPDDLSAFPDAVRKAIIQKRHLATPNSFPVVSRSTAPPPVPQSQPVEGSNTAFLPPLQSDQKASATSTSTDDVAPTELPLTRFESTIIGSYSDEEIKSNQMVVAQADRYFTPVFTDDLPQTQSIDGADAIKTLQFINQKLRKWKYIFYYDSELKAFVYGTASFKANGRIKIAYFDSCVFHPNDLNPGKIETITRSDGQMSVGVYTTNSQNTVTVISFNGKIKAHTFQIPVEDDGDAQSVGRAMSHLVQLYGGKPDDF